MKNRLAVIVFHLAEIDFKASARLSPVVLFLVVHAWQLF